MTDKKIMYEYLLDRLTKLTSENVAAFMQDLCTYAEIENMAQRLYSAKMILEGKTYNQISEETQISTVTLSRVSTCVKHGGGGYKAIIDKT